MPRHERKCPCGAPATSSRHRYCDTGRARANRRRQDRAVKGKTAARGYGGAHRKLRRQWEREIERGEVACARCGRLIGPDEHWDLGHSDTDRSVYTGPEHRACNRATAGRRPNERRHSRQW
jgi:hypothetical protein